MTYDEYLGLKKGRKIYNENYDIIVQFSGKKLRIFSTKNLPQIREIAMIEISPIGAIGMEVSHLRLNIPELEKLTGQKISDQLKEIIKEIESLPIVYKYPAIRAGPLKKMFVIAIESETFWNIYEFTPQLIKFEFEPNSIIQVSKDISFLEWKGEPIIIDFTPIERTIEDLINKIKEE